MRRVIVAGEPLLTANNRKIKEIFDAARQCAHTLTVPTRKPRSKKSNPRNRCNPCNPCNPVSSA
jgi:hypothetical protein